VTDEHFQEIYCNLLCRCQRSATHE